MSGATAVRGRQGGADWVELASCVNKSESSWKEWINVICEKLGYQNTGSTEVSSFNVCWERHRELPLTCVGWIASEKQLKGILEMKLCTQAGNSSWKAHVVIVLGWLQGGSSVFHILISIRGLTWVARVMKFPLCVIAQRISRERTRSPIPSQFLLKNVNKLLLFGIKLS